MANPVAGTYEYELARIDSTFLGIEDHGCFTFMVGLDYGGSHQGFGHIILGTKHDPNGKTGEIIQAILKAAGVDQWESLKGRTVIAVKEQGHNGLVRGLLPPPTTGSISGFVLGDDGPEAHSADLGLKLR